MNSRRIACKLCRERKVRCPGQQPVCDRCRRAGEECTYLPAQRISKTSSNLSETVEALQKRLNDAEALIHSMNRYPNNAMPMASSFDLAGWPTPPEFSALAASSLSDPSGNTAIDLGDQDLGYQQPSEPQSLQVSASHGEANGQNNFQNTEQMDFDLDFALDQVATDQSQLPITQSSSSGSPSTTTTTTLPTSQSSSTSNTTPQPPSSTSISTILPPLEAYFSSVIQRESEVSGLAASVADYIAWMRNVPSTGAPPVTNAVYQQMLANIEIRVRELVEISQKGHEEPLKDLLGALSGSGDVRVAELEERLEKERREHTAFFRTEYDACKFLKEQMQKRP